MRNKNYMIKVKMIKETEMIVSEKSMQKAMMKVSKVLNDYVENNIDLKKIFDKKPNFLYKAELMNNLSNNDERNINDNNLHIFQKVIILNNEIKYNVNLVVKSNTKTKEELIKIFNEKLLKVIILSEKNIGA